MTWLLSSTVQSSKTPMVGGLFSHMAVLTVMSEMLQHLFPSLRAQY